MARSYKRDSRGRFSGGGVSGAIKKRRTKKLNKLQAKHKRIAGYVKKDFVGTPLEGSGLHRSVARRQARRGAKIQRLKKKVSR